MRNLIESLFAVSLADMPSGYAHASGQQSWLLLGDIDEALKAPIDYP